MDNIYFNEILETHKKIQRWLSGSAQQAELPFLLAHFSPLFSMVGVDGVIVDYNGLAAFFSDSFGKSPGFKIGIDEFCELASNGNFSVVSYREHETDNTTNKTVRRLTVVFERSDERIRWRYLQETACVA